MRHKLIQALRAHAEGHIRKHKVNVEILLDHAVGTGKQADIVEAIEQELKIMAEYDDQLEMLAKYFQTE